MSEIHLDPAKSIIAKIGGVDVVASVTGKHISRVYRWMYPKERGGTGGLIPQVEAIKLLSHARSNSIDLDAEEILGVAPSEPVRGTQSAAVPAEADEVHAIAPSEVSE